jgi:hypothetical protein
MVELSELELRRQRAATNQSLFREVNERIEDLSDDALFSSFVCECLDESCAERVAVTLQEYEWIRSDSNSFFVVPGHQVAAVEEVLLAEEGRYLVVSKLGAGRAVANDLDPRGRGSPQ